MSTAVSARIEAIDVLRGLALALMLLVNNPGSWSAVYAPFLHADWHGITPTDLVFPFFLFVVGASMACSLRTQISNSGLPWLGVLKRSFLLFFIGFLLNIIPFDQAPENWRIMGVLQRIGLCFLLVAVLLTWVRERWLLSVGTGILIGYWLLLIVGSNSPYSLEHNLVRQIDLAILGSSHMWQGKGLAFDPEGILSSVGAAATVLSGYLVCIKILLVKKTAQQIWYLFIVGALLLALGLVWSIWLPINKALWTGSFVLISSGWACFSLAIIILLSQICNVKLGLHALKVYGSNPILIYVLAWLFAVALSRTTLTVGENNATLQAFLYQLMQQIMPDKLASLSYALLFTCLFYLMALWLYNKRIFVKL